eukprot:TRINITY_DN939_c1_g1_i4.p1 TRINITY_DN939_c1_g1~~TRINITY_DN939_c1_g1_i4.p1  ORF type:complete len:335 (-),score=10.25 TRINITY_DN939_c1_g1_i4:1354-2337(-)
MIAIGAVIIPVRTSQLYTQLAAKRAVLGPLPQSDSARIAVYAGRITEIRAFSDFFFEFFHRLAKPPKIRMVGLSDQQPTPELRAFQELNDSQLTVVEGSALSDRDLIRVRAHQADAIMLMADRFCADTEKEDLSVLFQVWVVKSYVKNVPLYVLIYCNIRIDRQNSSDAHIIRIKFTSSRRGQEFLQIHKRGVFDILQLQCQLYSLSYRFLQVSQLEVWSYYRCLYFRIVQPNNIAIGITKKFSNFRGFFGYVCRNNIGIMFSIQCISQFTTFIYKLVDKSSIKIFVIVYLHYWKIQVWMGVDKTINIIIVAFIRLFNFIKIFVIYL